MQQQVSRAVPTAPEELTVEWICNPFYHHASASLQQLNIMDLATEHDLRCDACDLLHGLHGLHAAGAAVARSKLQFS
jgi:hypothetical protein